MTHYLFDILLSVLFLGVFEAVIKPAVSYFTKKTLIKFTPLVLSYVDDVIPVLFRANSYTDLDKLVRNKFSELTGEDWSTINIDYFWRLYDLRVTLSKFNSSEQEG